MLLGPMAFISICSSAGVKWVSERTGSTSFAESAHEFAAQIYRILKIQKRPSLPPIEEPDLETALKFTTGRPARHVGPLGLLTGTESR